MARRRLLVLTGLIPARAGKTPTYPSHCQLNQAHPRAGGENFIAKTRPFVHPGLIPARAGKTIVMMMT